MENFEKNLICIKCKNELKFCHSNNKDCYFLQNDKFLECTSICEVISDKLIEFVIVTLPRFIKINGPDGSGEYPLYKLFEFANISNKN